MDSIASDVRPRTGVPMNDSEAITKDYVRASADLKRYLPLKLATLVWFVLVFSVGIYGLSATWNEWWPYSVLGVRDLGAAKPAVYSFFGGLLGAGVYAFRGFYWAAGPQSATDTRYQYDPNWTLWYFARPLLGPVVGIVSFGALRGGIAVLGNATNSGSAVATYFVVSFLAGFALTEELGWLQRTARQFFRSDSPS